MFAEEIRLNEILRLGRKLAKYRNPYLKISVLGKYWWNNDYRIAIGI